MKKVMMKKVVSVVLVTSMLISYQVYGASNRSNHKKNNVTTTVTESTSEMKTVEETTSKVLEEETTSTPDTTEIVTIKQTDNIDEWKLIWSDEFDGNKLDNTKWSYQIGNGYNGWGNYEKQYYTDDNVEVSDGTLKITAKEESVNGFKYTSSRIRTVTDDGTKLFTAKYGKFEARMKLPEGQGLWPAFWMMPADSEYGSWPLSGEIDIMEARGRVLDTVNGTIHFGETRPFNKSLGGSYTFGAGEDITGYHVYGVEWNENTIIWYVDGVEYYRTSNWYTMNEDGVSDYPAPFDKEFYLILNLAVGGVYDNYVTPASSVLPGTMEVDYVRVYQQNDGYKESGIEMPEGTRDSEAMAKTPIFENGNLLADINFDTVNENAVYTSAIDYSTRNWYFINSEYIGGKAELSKVSENGKTYSLIKIEDPGSDTYAIQLTQRLPLAKGYVYKVSFDAKSIDGNRTIKVKPVGGSDRNYANYNESFVANLTSEMNTYEFSFMMEDETDMKAMLQFNVGKLTGDIEIGNVVVKVIDTYNTQVKTEETVEETTTEIKQEETTAQETTQETTQEETTEKVTQEETTEVETKPVIEKALENGDFSQGLNVWSVYGTYYALEEKNGNVYGKVYTKPKTNPWDRMWMQEGIYLTKGETYTITFDARSSADNQKFAAVVEDDVYTKSLYKEFTVGTQWQTFSYTFVAGTDSELTLKYYLGMVSTDCKLYLDNVKIVLN